MKLMKTKWRCLCEHIAVVKSFNKLLPLEFLSGYITVRLLVLSTACCYFEFLIFNLSRVFSDHLKLVADNLLFVIFLVVDLFVFWVSFLEFA